MEPEIRLSFHKYSLNESVLHSHKDVSALPTSDVKARPIIGIGVRAIIRGQFLSAELNDLLSLHCVKTIGSPADSD
jgi:hypothetical protein